MKQVVAQSPEDGVVAQQTSQLVRELRADDIPARNGRAIRRDAAEVVRCQRARVHVLQHGHRMPVVGGAAGAVRVELQQRVRALLHEAEIALLRGEGIAAFVVAVPSAVGHVPQLVLDPGQQRLDFDAVAADARLEVRDDEAVRLVTVEKTIGVPAGAAACQHRPGSGRARADPDVVVTVAAMRFQGSGSVVSWRNQEEEVVAVAAHQGVVPLVARFETIVARAAFDQVVAVRAVQCVVTGARSDRVGVRRPENVVVAVGPRDRCHALPCDFSSLGGVTGCSAGKGEAHAFG